MTIKSSFGEVNLDVECRCDASPAVARSGDAVSHSAARRLQRKRGASGASVDSLEAQGNRSRQF